MKTAWVIVCSFLLAAAPMLSAQSPAPASCTKQARACCQHGHVMPCCVAKSSPDSQSAPAAPAQSGSQNTLSILAPNLLTWILPADPADSIASVPAPSSMTAGAPLYARNCTRLL